MEIRVFFFLLFALPQFSKLDLDADVSDLVEGGDLAIVGDPSKEFSDGIFSPAPGVHTLCVFPKNPARLVPAGEETELLVGVHNEGESTLNVIAISASLHLPVDHHMFVQNLTAQDFRNASVPYSAQATFPYIFAVSKYLQPGSFDLVGTIIYEIDQQPYQSFFYNGTIEVVEAGGILSIESVFLVTLGVALIGLFGLWAYGQIQHLSKLFVILAAQGNPWFRLYAKINTLELRRSIMKIYLCGIISFTGSWLSMYAIGRQLKTKKAPKVEVGTRTADANLEEWLQGTAYTHSLSNKSKKKK